MDFTNRQIEIQQLPIVEEVQLHPLERKYLTVQRIVIGIIAILLTGIFVSCYFFVEEAKDTVMMYVAFGFLLLLLAANYIGNIISFRKRGYAIREKDVLYRSGWLVKKMRIVPLNRIQHISVQSGPIERMFGLSSVSLFTAGNHDADFSIKGLKEETAQQLKEWITAQLDNPHAKL